MAFDDVKSSCQSNKTLCFHILLFLNLRKYDCHKLSKLSLRAMFRFDSIIHFVLGVEETCASASGPYGELYYGEH